MLQDTGVRIWGVVSNGRWTRDAKGRVIGYFCYSAAHDAAITADSYAEEITLTTVNKANGS